MNLDNVKLSDDLEPIKGGPKRTASEKKPRTAGPNDLPGRKPGDVPMTGQESQGKPPDFDESLERFSKEGYPEEDLVDLETDIHGADATNLSHITEGLLILVRRKPELSSQVDNELGLLAEEGIEEAARIHEMMIGSGMSWEPLSEDGDGDDFDGEGGEGPGNIDWSGGNYMSVSTEDGEGYSCMIETFVKAEDLADAMIAEGQKLKAFCQANPNATWSGSLD